MDFKELDRDEAKAALEGIAEGRGLNLSVSQLKSLVLAFPTGPP